MNRFTLILNGFVLGFLFNSVVMRLTGVIDRGDIVYPVTLLILSGILLAARLTTRDT